MQYSLQILLQLLKSFVFMQVSHYLWALDACEMIYKFQLTFYLINDWNLTSRCIEKEYKASKKLIVGWKMLSHPQEFINSVELLSYLSVLNRLLKKRSQL